MSASRISALIVVVASVVGCQRGPQSPLPGDHLARKMGVGRVCAAPASEGYAISRCEDFSSHRIPDGWLAAGWVAAEDHGVVHLETPRGANDSSAINIPWEIEGDFRLDVVVDVSPWPDRNQGCTPASIAVANLRVDLTDFECQPPMSSIVTWSTCATNLQFNGQQVADKKQFLERWVVVTVERKDTVYSFKTSTGRKEPFITREAADDAKGVRLTFGSCGAWLGGLRLQKPQ